MLTIRNINVAWEKRNKIDAYQRKQIARIHREVIKNYFADSIKGGVGSPLTQKEVFFWHSYRKSQISMAWHWMTSLYPFYRPMIMKWAKIHQYHGRACLVCGEGGVDECWQMAASCGIVRRRRGNIATEDNRSTISTGQLLSHKTSFKIDLYLCSLF